MKKRLLALVLTVVLAVSLFPAPAAASTRKFKQNFAYRDSITFEVPARSHVELAVTSPQVEISRYWAEIVSSSGKTVMGRKSLYEPGWMSATGRRVVIFTGDLPAGTYYFKTYYFSVGTGMIYSAGSDMEQDDYNRSKYNGQYYEIEWRCDCYHDVTTTTTVRKATCAEAGRQETVCECGEVIRSSYTEKLPHTGEWNRVTEPTCDKAGTEKMVCSVCGKTDTRDVPKLGHTYGDWSVIEAAACGQKGTEERTCTRCGQKESRTVAALSHSYTPWSVSEAAACGQKGTEVQTCTRCGEKKTREIKALTHRFGNWTASVPATCAQEGTETRTCSLCAETETRSVPALKTHSYGSWEVTKQGDCTTKGEKQRICAVCGYVEKSDTTLEDNHSFGDWTVSVAATCEKKGTEVNTCALCGKKGTRDIPALEHKYTDWTVVTPAACGKEGKESKACALCEKKETRGIPALEHSYGEWSVKTLVTCTQEGSEVRTCSLCGGAETRPVPIVEHTYGQWKIIKKGSCSTEGEKEQVCTVCGKVDRQPTDLEDNHSFGAWKQTEKPTCVKKGTEIRVCSLCAKEDSRSVSKLEHSYGSTVWEMISKPTCTVAGKEKRTCQTCGETETRTLPATGHTFGNWTQENGRNVHQCSVCNYVEAEKLSGERSEVSVTRANASAPTVIVLVVPAFSDVSSTSWYQSVVTYAYNLGLMVGNSETTFNPLGNMTVGEAVTMAARARNSYNGGNNNDFKSPAANQAWYQPYVDYAIKQKIMKQGDFDSYERVATRSEMAYLFANALPAEGMKAINAVTTLPDVDQNTKYSQEIFKLYNAGIVTGSDDKGTFSPDKPITRSEAAAIITRVTLSSERRTLALK